ncbi:MAG: diguanylate cyclase [Gammaproteobacteria bacterium]|nr:diguanylate cyclase [Gammaproteobacteria bacterium]
MGISTRAGDLTLSVSVGVAVRGPSMRGLGELFKQADDALYAAKRGARNRIEITPQSD